MRARPSAAFLVRPGIAFMFGAWRSAAGSRASTAGGYARWRDGRLCRQPRVKALVAVSELDPVLGEVGHAAVCYVEDVLEPGSLKE
jgi:hypothetical protein